MANAAGSRSSAPAYDCTIFVGNVAPITTQLELRDALRAVCADLSDVRVVLRQTGKRREFAFASFPCAGARAKALVALRASVVVVSDRTLHFKDAHRPAKGVGARSPAAQARLRSRVPCPLDSTHSVRFSRLRQHLLVCPARDHGTQRWYRAGVNRVNADAGASTVGEPAAESGKTMLKEEPIEVHADTGSPPPRGAPVPLAELEALRRALLDAVDAVCELRGATREVRHADALRLPPLEVLAPPSLAEYVRSAPRSKRNPESTKHRTQQASIAGHLEQLGALASPPAAVVEFGAGSGFLSSAIYAAFPGATARSTYYLVDRATPPLRRGDKRVAARCLRVNCDLADLWLPGLVADCDTLRGAGPHRALSPGLGAGAEGLDCAAAPSESAISGSALPGAQSMHVGARPSGIVGIGKHLCGEATDLSLRCFAVRSCAADSPARPDFLAVAPCCYHRCRWSSLVGRSALEAAGISRAMFRLAARLSPMGHNAVLSRAETRDSAGTGEEAAAEIGAERVGEVDEEDEEDAAAIKRDVGKLFIRLVNGARARYLVRHGWASRIVRYVPSAVTPQNALILAKRDETV